METSLRTFLSYPWHLHYLITVTMYNIILLRLKTIHTYIQEEEGEEEEEEEEE